jgi:hypothetical protein
VNLFDLADELEGKIKKPATFKLPAVGDRVHIHYSLTDPSMMP